MDKASHKYRRFGNQTSNKGYKEDFRGSVLV